MLTGVIIATIGALLRKAESVATGGQMRISPLLSPIAGANSRPAVASSAPVSRSAADTMKSTPTVAMAGLANPAKVSVGESTPNAASVKSAPIMMRSGAATSRTMAPSATRTTPSVSQPCHASSIGAARYTNIRHTVAVMTRAAAGPSGVPPFSEKGFYLSEFRGRTLAVAARGGDLARPAPLEAVLKELEANATRVVIVSSDGPALVALAGGEPIPADAERLEGAVWRALGAAPRVGLHVAGGSEFPRAVRRIAVRLGVSKLVWIDPDGGWSDAEGVRQSFVDLTGLGAAVRDGPARESERRRGLLREVEAALDAGVPSINLCTLEGLADELFTYTGSGTLFTRERYVDVRPLRLDDFDAAADLVARGVAEGYLAPRSERGVDRVLANGFGAFVEGRHLAGVGALLDYPAAAVGEIAALYTLTRFVGEGVGGHLVAFALDRARARQLAPVFACTASERVVAFFERNGFRRVPADRLPAEKWRDYDPARRAQLTCLAHELD